MDVFSLLGGLTAESTVYWLGNRARRQYCKYRLGSIWKRFEDGRYHSKGQKRIEEPDPKPNKGLDPGSPEPVSRTNAALCYIELSTDCPAVHYVRQRPTQCDEARKAFKLSVANEVTGRCISYKRINCIMGGAFICDVLDRGRG